MFNFISKCFIPIGIIYCTALSALPPTSDINPVVKSIYSQKRMLPNDIYAKAITTYVESHAQDIAEYIKSTDKHISTIPYETKSTTTSSQTIDPKTILQWYHYVMAVIPILLLTVKLWVCVRFRKYLCCNGCSCCHEKNNDAHVIYHEKCELESIYSKR